MTDIQYINEWLFLCDEELLYHESWNDPDGTFYRIMTSGERIFVMYFPLNKKLSPRIIK